MASVADLEQVDSLLQNRFEVRGLAFFEAEPGLCDVCVHTRVGTSLAAPAVVEGRTVFGLWARMCRTCFRDSGVGLGVGRGQVLLSVTTA